MSIIEQAGRRLEELQRSGVELAARAAAQAAPGQPVAVQPGADPRLARPGSGATQSRKVNIDPGHLARVGLVTPDAQRSALAEEMREIKRPLLANARGDGGALRRGNCIMVTSSVAGEGKTFTALNLALSIAMEVDTRALLVDADVLRPAVLDRLGLPPSMGLMDLLVDRALSLPDVLLKTNIDKLSVLPAGSLQANATELLASEAMRRLVDELATRYPDRIIVFDAPPLLMSSESSVLAEQVGQIVLVVEAGRTAQTTVLEALGKVERCPVVLMLLNKSTVRSDVGRYGYTS